MCLRRVTQILALAILLHSTASRGAEEELPTSKAEMAAKARLVMMRKSIDDFQVRSSRIESPAALKFREEPILRYNDQSRLPDNGAQALLDATVWSLGETGRPTALITLEIYPTGEAAGWLTYEFVSLTPSAFQMENSHGYVWIPSGTKLTMAPLADAVVPSDTKRSRLVQLRQLARRFTAQEQLGAEKIELRLMTQPIYRYDDEAAGILDGAVFVFANGTNPEMGLLLECSDKQWSYGVCRLASAALFAQFDGKPFDVPPKGPGYPADAPYTATRHPIALPSD